ncbi:GNAT family N-acetyltransferase [Glaciibacter sp. 2TAF33]|uniref:GNAT family N-acetyltransferase n=1 Tax=Glaciibacter sp. 2TAF33 TaxID=3233015 RepID=UPI003F90AC3A
MPDRIRFSIAVEPPRQDEVDVLLRLSAEYAEALYPPESNFLLSIDELEQPAVSFYVARDATARAYGIAALVELDAEGTAELKRMFVHPDARGHGLASGLLDRIEADAASRGIRRIVLETGPRHASALALYARHGYLPIPQFGQYVGEEFSVCLAKQLRE